jgi:hypothetical protein
MARRQLTKSKAEEYRKASKKRKGEILDLLCEDTGWSRDNARKQLKKALTRQSREKTLKKARPKKYSARSRTILANIWALCGTPCGQYLHAMIQAGLIGRLVSYSELKDGPKNKGSIVREDDSALAEIAQISSATIDRYLKDIKKSLEPLSRSTTKKSTYALRNEIPFGKSYDKVSYPGYLSTDTVAHCGSSLKGDHLWTLNSTDVLIGWTETVTIKSRARANIIKGHDIILGDFPYKVIGVNYDGGTEFINYDMFDYSVMHNYQMTRSRPYHSNDNAHVEQRNGDIVRRYAFRYRYESEVALNLLNALWYYVNLRKNYLIPCKKCIGHTKTRSGRTRGIYDKPKTPYQRLLDSKVLSKDKDKLAELKKRFEGLNDAHITRRIIEIQQQLIDLISDTEMVEYINEVVEEVLAA